MILSELFETADWAARLWLHYSDHPMVTLNSRGFHQDPMGIYLFPIEHPPDYPVWHEKKYRFTCRLTPNAQVLDYASITDEQLNTLLGLTDSKAQFEASIANYPPKTRKDTLHVAWEQMRMHYMRRVPAAWTKVFLKLGWDAIYDESGAIHSAEPQQLLVLNPRVLKVVEQQTQKQPIFAAMQKVAKDVAEIAGRFGPVTVEGPRRIPGRLGNKSELGATVSVNRSDRNYIRFRIWYQDDPGFRTKINATVQYANPSLNSGYGATYNMITGTYERFSDLAQIEQALSRVFKMEEAA